MQRLPIGVQSFDALRKDNLLYVDRTKKIYDLATKKLGQYCFLSRPRRFGKSLLISTLKELFLGNKKLFEGLWIHTSDYAWKEHHVIHFDFSMMAGITADNLHTNLIDEITQLGVEHDINLDAFSGLEGKFKCLVSQLAKSKPVVLLIDEYDSPLLRHVDNIPMMQKAQAILRIFYMVIKGLGGDISFLFMTGVTKFSKTSVFSGLNNLIDLTLSTEAADLLGYTDQEIDTYFTEHMHVIAQQKNCSIADIKSKMRHWYNGYQFSKINLTVYNPFSVLMYLGTKELENYWFETGTPFFLVKLIQEKEYSIEDLEQVEMPADTLKASFDLEKMKITLLMLQTGYLTIKDYDEQFNTYTLGYPNEETKNSFLLYFIDTISKGSPKTNIAPTIKKIITALNNNDLKALLTSLQVFFASIPYTVQIAQEKYYQTIFYIILTLIGAHVDAEVTTNDGRIDAIIKTDDHIYIFEFKINDSAEFALQQIENKKYHQRFLHDNKQITLVGVSFNTEQRNITDWIIKEFVE